MNTLQDLKQWAAKIGKHASMENIDLGKGSFDLFDKSDDLHFYIYTNENRYSISATVYDDGHTYLGCTASCRKPRAGEDWTRGSDLADGDLSLKTWTEILGDIVAYELVRVHKKHKLPKINETNETNETNNA